MESELPPVAIFFDIPGSKEPVAFALCNDVFDSMGWRVCREAGEADCLFSTNGSQGEEGQMVFHWPSGTERRAVGLLSDELTERLWHGDEAAALIWRQAMQVIGPESSDLHIQSAVSGSRAWVYRADCHSLGIPVVAKAQPHEAELLRREARVLAALPASVAPQFYRLDEWRGQPLLLMEDCGRLNLSESTLVRDRKARLVEAIPALLATLNRLHSAGWIHGDLKPEHILFTPGGRAVFIDWGLAEGQGVEPLVHAGQWSGTPLYMAPERFDGVKPDSASDLYALGVILIECVLGGFPAAWLDLPATALSRTVQMHWRNSDREGSFLSQALVALTSPDPARRFEGLALLSACSRDDLDDAFNDI